MAGAIQALKISELVNYYENPRHAIGSSEEDTLKKLFDAVGIQYMLNLAEDVQRNGLLGNQQIVVVYSETIHKYVVYEGNRRVAAIKLLLAPEHFGFLDRATIEKAKKIRQQGEIPDVINCYITNEEEAFFIMERLRLFNKARVIEDKLIPWIQEYTHGKSMDDNSAGEQSKPVDTDGQSDADKADNNPTNTGSNFTGSGAATSVGGESDRQQDDGTTGSSVNGRKGNFGGSRNLPYFFQGLNYSSLNPNDAETHGVTAVCRELQLFSDRRLVATYPIATTFLVRSIIEQSIIYYSKKHYIQGQNKLIWEKIKDIGKLSKIIENYKRNLPNYITDTTMRQYFTNLFGNYEDNVDPLNWVVHRPAEFQLDSSTLVELPRKGLLTLINFLLS